MPDNAENPNPLKEMTQEGLQDLLGEYKEALEQEFDEGEDENTETVRKRITRLIPEADNALEYLLNNADSDSVRLSAAKFVYEVRLGKRLKDADAGGALEDLFSKLTAPSESTD